MMSPPRRSRVMWCVVLCCVVVCCGVLCCGVVWFATNIHIYICCAVLRRSAFALEMQDMSIMLGYGSSSSGSSSSSGGGGNGGCYSNLFYFDNAIIIIYIIKWCVHY
jgi:uncharacterized membrane protein YgcG